MTQKSGQKCTAIRRVFVPEALYDAGRRGHLGAAGQDHRGQPAQRIGAHGRAGQPRAAGQRARGPGPAAGAGRSAARRRARTPWSMPTRRSPAASAPRCWARATPTARTACTTPKCSAPWPRCCPTATGARAGSWCARPGLAGGLAVRQRPGRRWPPPALNWPTATAACTSSAPDVAAAAHRPRQRDAAVAARRPRPRRWRRGAGRPACAELLPPPRAVQASTAVLATLSAYRSPDHYNTTQ
jgi:hypothetical protein